jgi:hypothetical protein
MNACTTPEERRDSEWVLQKTGMSIKRKAKHSFLDESVKEVGENADSEN